MDTTRLLERLLATSSTIASIDLDRGGHVARANPAFVWFMGAPEANVVGRPLRSLLVSSAAERAEGWLAGASLPRDPVRINFAAVTGAPFTLRCLVERGDGGLRIVGEAETQLDRTAAEDLMGLNNELATLARERARRERELERTRQRLEATLEELRTSYWHLQKIQQVLPLCMNCGKVKTNEAHWESVIDYLKANEIFLSHGYCPACADEVSRKYGLEDDAPPAGNKPTAGRDEELPTEGEET